MIQGPQLIIVLAIILLLFGGSKLPKLARSLGQAQKEFRDGLKDGQEDDDAPAASSTKADTGNFGSTNSGSTGATTDTSPPADEMPKPANTPGDDDTSRSS
ncbi:MAG: twin-arginine translocase TatA/TatE family subunit [Ilumatobacteraceae bacterium]